MLDVIVLLILAAIGAVALTARRRRSRRTVTLQKLLDLADRLEADLKSCRNGLQQAHAVMTINPDHPDSSAQDAHHAVDAGLQALLRQRIWIRDHVGHASQQELDAAFAALRYSHDRLQPLLQALSSARHDLDQAMRDHIRRDADE